MRFLAPIAFAFASVLPLVVLFYLLKRKRVTRLVPSTVLWQRFLAETQASAPFQKLRHNWLLLFQLLMLCLLILALARPYFSGTVRSGGLQVLVLDASASMQATDESPSRFERARAEALKLVDALGEGGSAQMAVLVAGSQTEVKQSRTANKAALRRALESARPSDSPSRVVDALRVAESLTRNEALSEVHLFSDGSVPDLSEFETKDLRLVFHKVGQRADNLAITSLDIKANPENPEQRAIFTSVANFSQQDREVRLDLSFEGSLVESRVVSVGPTNTTPVVFLAAQDRDGVFQVRFEANDDLAVDNEASRVSLLPQPVRVILVSPGNRLMERALMAAGSHVELELVRDYDAALEQRGDHDMVVLDDVMPSVWPTVPLLAFAVANTNWFEGSLGRMEAPSIVDWRSTHPLLRFVSFDNVQIAESWVVPRSDWAVPLVESPQSALILAGELGRQRIVWVGFNPLESTWPLRISFPIFIANSLEWLNPAALKEELFAIRPGDAIRYPLVSTIEEARVILPDNSVERVPLGPDVTEFVFGRTAKRGLYRVELGTNRLVFAASLLDATESNIQPRESIRIGRFTEIAADQEKRASLEYWRWFALAALGVLMFEWWWFHRRTA